MGQVKRCPSLGLMVVLVSALLCCGAGSSYAGIITEIKLSPDSQRLIIRSQGDVGSLVAKPLRNPSRLALDFDEAQVKNLPSVLTFNDRLIPRIRIANFKRGCRIVADFGRYAVPEHKIRRIDDYVIVFLGKFRPAAYDDEPAQSSSMHKGSQISKPDRLLEIDSKNSASKARRRRTSISNAQNGASFFLKSAKVVRDRIVLEVFDSKDHNRPYVVNLDLDLSNRGFNGATIIPIPLKMPDKKRTPRARTAAKPEKTSQKGQFRGPTRAQTADGETLASGERENSAKGPCRMATR